MGLQSHTSITTLSSSTDPSPSDQKSQEWIIIDQGESIRLTKYLSKSGRSEMIAPEPWSIPSNARFVRPNGHTPPSPKLGYIMAKEFLALDVCAESAVLGQSTLLEVFVAFRMSTRGGFNCLKMMSDCAYGNELNPHSTNSVDDKEREVLCRRRIQKSLIRIIFLREREDKQLRIEDCAARRRMNWGRGVVKQTRCGTGALIHSKKIKGVKGLPPLLEQAEDGKCLVSEK
ncbi:hypothetical protein CEXT_227321 [Caerostris extrusa]|uniref:Uncharacterized protein n=1 Tax=Caerostris extrusa TaxID=172846 RepID=A0AAV4XJ54_CAEEX|nr:hypothetical protein CEXT_227321 [Caerostris extrusa]